MGAFAKFGGYIAVKWVIFYIYLRNDTVCDLNSYKVVFDPIFIFTIAI